LDVLKVRESQLKTKLAHLKNEEMQNFMSRILCIRNQGYKNAKNDIFEKAWKDAENTVFKIICMTPKEICEAFNVQFRKDKDNNDKDKELGNNEIYNSLRSFSWTHDLSSKQYDLIPLNAGIVTPRKRDKLTNQMVPIKFFVSRFYENPLFLERCKKYYDQYNIEIEIKKTTPANKKIFTINLKIKNCCNLINI